MRTLILTIMTGFLFTINSYADVLQAYSNLRNQFIIQDGYNSNVYENLEIRNFKVGKTVVAYIDNTMQFKIYYNGAIYKPTKMIVNNYYISDNLCMFEGDGILGVFDNGETKILTGRYSDVHFSDSLISYFDDNTQQIFIYYNKEKNVLEDFLASSPITDASIGANLLAYNNYQNLFKIFYNGTIITQEEYAVQDLKAERNTVAYIDINNYLKVFYKGDTYLLDEFLPKSYLVGNNMVAFISSDNQFKIFYDGDIKTIGYFQPQKMMMKDFVFWYKDFNGYFKIFYEGNFYDGDIVVPTEQITQYRAIAYIDRFNKLRLFNNGNFYDITTMAVKGMSLDYDAIRYILGLNSVQIFSDKALN